MKNNNRTIRPLKILRKEKCRFIASPVASGEFHWFEAGYAQIDIGLEKYEAWLLVPNTLHDLGPISDKNKSPQFDESPTWCAIKKPR